jgi:hypothetical protein
MKIQTVLSTLFLAAMLSVTAFAQTTTYSTTLSSAVTQTQLFVNLASVSNITAASNGNPANATTLLFVDREEMRVISLTGTTVMVQRASDGSPQQLHQSGATVYLGPAQQAPVGPWTDGSSLSSNCTSTTYAFLPLIVTGGTSGASGNQYTCPSSGPQANQWVQTSMPAPIYNSDGFFFVPFSAGYTTASANPGTLGFAVAGASNVPVLNGAVTSTGTNTITFSYILHVPSRLLTGKGIAINDVKFLYGNSTGTLGTQAATLASGTYNSTIVFSTITLPAAGASETASTVTPVRADSGTLAITPSAASANVTAVTAGQFYTQQFTPSAPIVVNSDLTEVLFQVTLQCTATTATTVSSPGVIVDYTNVVI